MKEYFLNKKIRNYFPITKDIVYFDSAALVLKPKTAAKVVYDFYTKYSVSSRTHDTPIGNYINQTVQETREKVAKLLDADLSEIIFTSGTTESINNFVLMIEDFVNSNDKIVISSFNHSSNMIPWINLANKKKIKVIITEDIINNIDKTTKIVAVSQETNNFSENLHWKKLVKKCKKYNVILFNDAAQAISHQKVSLNESDVIVFSTNKFYGPTGLGILAIKKNIIKEIKPAKFGGGSITSIDKNYNWTLKDTIAVFEPGTPNLAGILMFNKALDFFNEKLGYKKTQKILTNLSFYIHEKLSELNNVDVFSKSGDFIILLNVKNVNPQDVATYLGDRNIYTIAGIFCAPFLRNIKSNYSYLRISLGVYNNYKDIDILIDELKNGGDFFEI